MEEGYLPPGFHRTLGGFAMYVVILVIFFVLHAPNLVVGLLSFCPRL